MRTGEAMLRDELYCCLAEALGEGDERLQLLQRLRGHHRRVDGVGGELTPQALHNGLRHLHGDSLLQNTCASDAERPVSRGASGGASQAEKNGTKQLERSIRTEKRCDLRPCLPPAYKRKPACRVCRGAVPGDRSASLRRGSDVGAAGEG